MRRTNGRIGPLAAATTTLWLLAACGGEGEPSSEAAEGTAGVEAAPAGQPAEGAEAASPDSQSEAAGATGPEDADPTTLGAGDTTLGAGNTTLGGGDAIPGGEAGPAEQVSPTTPDLTSSDAVSAIGRLLDSLLGEGFASEPAAAAGDPAHVEQFAGDSLLAERFAARPRLQLGTQLRAVSDRFVTTADHRRGDPVVATLAEDVPGPGGRVLVRQGAKLLGVVTASQSAFGPGETAFLEVAFLTLATPTWERPMTTRVVAVLPPEEPEPTPEDAEQTPGGPEDSAEAGDLDSLDVRPDSVVPARVAPSPGEIPAGAVLVVELEETLVLPMTPTADEVPDGTPTEDAEMSRDVDILTNRLDIRDTTSPTSTPDTTRESRSG